MLIYIYICVCVCLFMHRILINYYDSVYACLYTMGVLNVCFDHIVVDNCGNYPCQNGASCMNAIGTFSCVCAPGFTDFYCQTGDFLIWMQDQEQLIASCPQSYSNHYTNQRDLTVYFSWLLFSALGPCTDNELKQVGTKNKYKSLHRLRFIFVTWLFNYSVDRFQLLRFKFS